MNQSTCAEQVQALLDTIFYSNGLEFVSIDKRIELARLLLDPDITDKLNYDKAMPVVAGAAFRLLEV